MIPRNQFKLHPALLCTITSFVLLSSSSCQLVDQTKKNTRESAVVVDICRFDLELSKIENQVDLQALCDQYPDFSRIYFHEIVPISSTKYDGCSSIDSLLNFLNDPFISFLRDTSQQAFAALAEVQEALAEALNNFSQIFEIDSVIHVYAFVSGLAYQSFLFEDQYRDALGIGLDMFLGPGFEYSRHFPNNPAFSSYLSRTFNRDHLIKKSLDLLIEDRFPPMTDVRLLDYMIRNGIKAAILEQTLPQVSDTVIMEFTSDQMQWCDNNELSIWSFFLDQDLIYKRDLQQIHKFINPSPHSPGMPERAPGQTGNFIGWKIVKSYLRNNPGIPIKDLLEETDSQKFLERARYRPVRID